MMEQGETSYQVFSKMTPESANELIYFLLDRGIVDDPEEANLLITAGQELWTKAEAGFTPEEREHYLEQGRTLTPDETDPGKFLQFLKDRDLRIYHEAKAAVDEEFRQKYGPYQQPEESEYMARLEDEIHHRKYFPAMFVSAPHIEEKVKGMFPGLPTPLLYATAVMDRHLRTDTFPAQKSPEVVGLFHPEVYDQQFEEELTAELIRTKPRVIGISNTSEGHYIALAMAEIVRQINQQHGFETIIIMGGSHEDGSNPEAYFVEKEGRLVGKHRTPKMENGQYVVNERGYGVTERILKPEHKDVMEQAFTPYNPVSQDLVDIIVAGDGQYALMKIMQIIANNSEKSNQEILKIMAEAHDEFKEVNGCGNVFVNLPGDESQEKETTVHELSNQHLDFNDLPYYYHGRVREIAFGTFPKHDAFGRKVGYKKTAQVMIGMGCNHACEFCPESGHLYKISPPRSVEHVIKELRILHENGYEALFFDDSTFTRPWVKKEETPEGTKIINQLDILLDAIIQLRQQGIKFDWGCQTTFDETANSVELFQKMKSAGCVFNYFGFEQLEAMEMTQKAKGYNKEEWKEKAITALDMCKQAGINAGISIQIGLVGEDGEPNRDCSETLAFAKELYDNKLLADDAVGLNINIPFPGSVQFAKWVASGKAPRNFSERFRRQKNFESAHEMAVLAMREADRVYKEAHAALGKALIGVRFNTNEINEMLKTYERSESKDFYFNDENWVPYVTGERSDSLHLGHASMSRPLERVRKVVERLFNEREELTEAERTAVAEEARLKAAEMVGLQSARGVAFGRNTTEAMSYVFWLAGLQEGDHVTVSDVENRSIGRLFQFHMDHGNPDMKDMWAAFPTYFARRGKRYDYITTEPTGVLVDQAEVLEPMLRVVSVKDGHNEREVAQQKIDDRVIKKVLKSVGPKTKVLVISHVARDTGKVLPIKEIVSEVRKANPDIFIVVDGAQALGNLPNVNFDDLGCDAYVATPHKTLSSTPLGLLYFDPNNSTVQNNLPRLNRLQAQSEQIILKHAFSPELGVAPNALGEDGKADEIEVADIAGFATAVGEYEQHGYTKGDFSEISEHRRKLKEVFRQQITSVIEDIGKKYGTQLRLREVEAESSFIYSFNIKGINGNQLAKALDANHVFVSYIDRARLGDDGIIRASFGLENTEEEIKEYRNKFELALESVIGGQLKEVRSTIDKEAVFSPGVSLGFLSWLGNKARSPIGRIATAASGMAAALGASAWLLSRSPRGPLASPALVAMKQAELREVDHRIARLERGQVESFSPGVDSYISNLQAEKAKYELLISMQDQAAFQRALGDQSVMNMAAYAEFTEPEKVALEQAFERIRDERIQRILERTGTKNTFASEPEQV